MCDIEGLRRDKASLDQDQDVQALLEAKQKEFAKVLLIFLYRDFVAMEDFWTSIFNFKSGLIGTWSWTTSAPGKGFTQLTMSGTKGSIIDSDIFHPAAFQANGECQLVDGTAYSMPKLQEMYLDTLGQRKKARLFPQMLNLRNR